MYYFSNFFKDFLFILVMTDIKYIGSPERIRNHNFKHSELMRKSRASFKKEIEKLLEERLKLAAKKAPYYKSVKLDKNKSVLKQLEQFPLLTKQEVRDFQKDLIFKGVDTKDMFKRESSGSTGEPFAVFKSKNIFDYYSAIVLNQLLHYGWTPLDITCILHGGGIGNLSPGIKSEDLLEHLIRNKPTTLSCYASYLVDIIKNNKGPFPKFNLKYIITHSEQSSKAERDLIEKKFNCPVYDEYGATEVGPIAIQCKNKNYHVFEDNVYLEIVDENGKPVKDGEMGAVALTDLKNDAMALVRYKVGDYAKISTKRCDCEYKNFKILESIEGRIEDSFVLKGGKIIPPGQLVSEIGIDDMLSVKEWQVLQLKEDLFRILIVKGKKYKLKTVEKLKKDLKKLLGKDVKIEVEYLERIETKSKKRQIYKSLVKKSK